MKRLTKFDIACLIERLPGNIPWSAPSLATFSYDRMTRSELVDWYNRLVETRGLKLSYIS